MNDFASIDHPSESAIIFYLPPRNRKILGRLEYDPEGGISIRYMDAADIAESLASSQAKYPILLGQMVKGLPFTIIDATVATTNFGMAGFVDVRISCSRLLIGVHLRQPTTAAFDEFRVSFTDLNAWFNAKPLQTTHQQLPVPESGHEMSIIAKHLTPFGFSPIGSEISLFSDQILSATGDDITRSAIQNQFEICIRVRQPLNLNESIFELFRLQALMSVLVGRQVFYTRVRFLLHGLEETERHRNAVTFLSKFARDKSGAKPARFDQILLPLPLIKSSLSNLWSSWIDRYDSYRSAAELFTSTELFGGQLLNFQLLAIMQALETFHRNRFGGKYIAESSYASIESLLKSAIPSEVQNDLRSALKSRLKFGNEYSLRKRLLSLANDLPGGSSGVIASLIHSRLKDFLGRAVDTRNYLTHFTSELHSASFHDEELYWATRLLRWFFIAVLLHDLGLASQELEKTLSRAEDLTFARNQLLKDDS